jgi:hypothetical protein
MKLRVYSYYKRDLWFLSDILVGELVRALSSVQYDKVFPIVEMKRENEKYIEELLSRRETLFGSTSNLISIYLTGGSRHTIELFKKTRSLNHMLLFLPYGATSMGTQLSSDYIESLVFTVLKKEFTKLSSLKGLLDFSKENLDNVDCLYTLLKQLSFESELSKEKIIERVVEQHVDPYSKKLICAILSKDRALLIKLLYMEAPGADAILRAIYLLNNLARTILLFRNEAKLLYYEKLYSIQLKNMDRFSIASIYRESLDLIKNSSQNILGVKDKIIIKMCDETGERTELS